MNFKYPYQERGKRADEFIQTLKRIWTDDVVNSKANFTIYLHQK
jgi:alkanesulfonate monooxygenase SsuD/methylene tetrahydromethanopterin reductase-like flavin-dependent oxidoreductase (luciferase family)